MNDTKHRSRYEILQ